MQRCTGTIIQRAFQGEEVEYPSVSQSPVEDQTKGRENLQQAKLRDTVVKEKCLLMSMA